jgi:hypothetical protein
MLATIYKLIPALAIGLIVASKVFEAVSTLLATLPK